MVTFLKDVKVNIFLSGVRSRLGFTPIPTTPWPRASSRAAFTLSSRWPLVTFTVVLIGCSDS